MNMNYSYPTTMYEIFWPKCKYFCYYLQFFAVNHENLFYPKLQKMFFYQKYVHFGEHTLIHCSQRTVVHIHVNAFSLKFTQHAKVTQTELNQEVTD